MSNPHLFSSPIDTLTSLKKRSNRIKKRFSPIKKLDESKYFLIHYDPVDPDWESVLRNFVTGLDPPFSEVIIPKKWPINVRSALRKLFLALDGYLSCHEPFIPIERILDLATSLEGEKILKKYRKDCFLSRFSLKTFSGEVSAPRVDSISEVFNYRYAINYIVDPEDYKLGLIPVDIKQKTLLEFESALEWFIPEEFNYTDEDFDFEVKNSIPCNSSMCISDFYDFKSKGTYDNDFDKVQDDIPALIGKRVKIPISAENCRDAVMLTPITSSYIRTCDKIINNMWSHNKWFTMIKNKESFLSRIRNFRKKHSFFVCFDFEKEGITKPRELILSVFKVLNKIHPRAFWGKLSDLYSNYSLYVDGETIDMNRGHGLGMANSLTSVVILAFLSVVASRMQDDNNCTLKGMDFDVLSFNDDTTISIKEEYFEDFEEYFFDTSEELGMRYKREKTFWGKEFVFCEEYSNEQFNNKKSYYQSALYTACMCINITQAKQFISSINFTEVLEDCFDFINSEFGYEFYEEEYLEPICFGGWFSKSIFDVDLSWVTKKEFTWENMSACLAFCASVGRKKSKDHPFLHENPEPLLFNLPQVERLHGKRYVQYWEKLYKLRQNIYNKSMFQDCDPEEVFLKYRKKKLRDVIPPLNLFKIKKLKFDDLIENKFNFYKSDNPLKDYLLYDKAMDYVIGEYGEYKRLTNHEILERLNYISSTSNITVFVPEDLKTYTNPLLEDSYWRPERVVAAMFAIYPFKHFEIPFIENEIVKEVKEKYELRLTRPLIELVNRDPNLFGNVSLIPLSKFILESNISSDELYSALCEWFSTQPGLTQQAEEELIEEDWDNSLLSVISLNLNNLGNQMTQDHVRLKDYIVSQYNQVIDNGTWVKIGVEGLLLVPRVNKVWYDTYYKNILALDQIYGFDNLSNSGWFKFTKIQYDNFEFFHPENIISLPKVRVLDMNIGGLNQDQGPVQRIEIPEELVIDKPDEDSHVSDELNEQSAFDLLENL